MICHNYATLGRQSLVSSFPKKQILSTLDSQSSKPAGRVTKLDVSDVVIRLAKELLQNMPLACSFVKQLLQPSTPNYYIIYSGWFLMPGPGLQRLQLVRNSGSP